MFVRLLPAVHRLDRVTSGLLILSLTRSNARALGSEIQNRLVKKVYLARVRGHFPENGGKPTIVDSAIQLRGDGVSMKESAAAASSSAVDAVTAAEASPSNTIAAANPFMSTRVPARVQTNVSADGEAAAPSMAAASSSSAAAAAASDPNTKSASTAFEFVSFDGTTSLVRCRPLQGRTHQIRTHLASLGFPIANDYIYGGILLTSNTHQDRSWEVMQEYATKQAATASSAADGSSSSASAQPSGVQDGCLECAASKADAERAASAAASSSSAAAVSSSSPSPSASPVYCSSIWLHCLHYSGPHWNYTTEASLPLWAQEGFDSSPEMNQPIELPAVTMQGVAAHRHGVNEEDEEDA